MGNHRIDYFKLVKNNVEHELSIYIFIYLCCFKDFILFTFRERGREGEREKNIIVWLSLARPLLGTWPATQASALTGNRTGDPLVHRPAPNPLSHISQG